MKRAIPIILAVGLFGLLIHVVSESSFSRHEMVTTSLSDAVKLNQEANERLDQSYRDFAKEAFLHGYLHGVMDSRSNVDYWGSADVRWAEFTNQFPVQ